MKITILSKNQVKKYKPNGKAALISINDLCDLDRPCNHVRRSLYTTFSFYFFEDVLADESGALTLVQAESIVRRLLHIAQRSDLDELVVHCVAGRSRSQAVGCFMAKTILADKALYSALYARTKGTGNPHVYQLLEDAYARLNNC